MENPCSVYLVRHGETQWNKLKKIQGHTDISLNKTGENQAEALAARLQHIKFAAVFSSDLQRAVKTAEILAGRDQLPVTKTRALRERNFGIFEGTDWLEKDGDVRRILASYQGQGDPEIIDGLESDQQMMGRVIPFIKATAAGFLGKNILMVAHGGLMRGLLIHLKFGTYETLPPGTIGNLAYAVLKSDGVTIGVAETEGIAKI